MFQLNIASDYFDSGDFVSGEVHLDEAEKAAKKIDSTAILEQISAERERIRALRQGEPVPEKREISGTGIRLT